jgi:pimeloyl-ACP methyl ester carboxylesterase
MPTLEARGVELSWSERGEGDPVLLIHETGTGAAVWDAVAAALSGQARVVSYDRRGWGASTAPPGYQRTTTEEQSEDAAVLIESLGAAPALLCGAGIGAVIALDLSLRRPELVIGAALVEPDALALLPAATEALSEDRHALEIAVAERGAEGAVELYLAGGLRALGAGSGRLPSALTAAARRRPAGIFAEMGAAARWSMPLVRLAEAKRPSLIVTAPSTPPLLGEAARALQGRLRASEAREVEAGRAPPHLGAPEEIASLVLELADSAAGH